MFNEYYIIKKNCIECGKEFDIINWPKLNKDLGYRVSVYDCLYIQSAKLCGTLTCLNKCEGLEENKHG